MLSGAARTDVPSDANLDDVRLLDARQLLDWLAKLDGQEVPRGAANDVLKLRADYRSTAVRTAKHTTVIHRPQPDTVSSYDVR